MIIAILLRLLDDIAAVDDSLEEITQSEDYRELYGRGSLIYDTLYLSKGSLPVVDYEETARC